MPRNEAAFRSELIKKAREAGWHAFPVETHSTRLGVPDMYARIPGQGAVWLELKHATPNKRGVDVRRSQVMWMDAEIEAGGNAFFVLWDDEEKIAHVVDGSMAEDLFGRQKVDNWAKLSVKCAGYVEIIKAIERSVHEEKWPWPTESDVTDI